MAVHPAIITETERFVFDLLKREQREGYVYHTFTHSETVADTARRLAKTLDLGEEAIEIVTLAGWLHDVGYTEIYHGHEEVSIRIASDFLRSQKYPDDKIQLVVGCIAATKVPQHPKNILEEIVADADLAGLGRKSFSEQSDLLRIEWDRALGKQYSDAEWLEQNIDLLAGHNYFTSAAKELFEEQQINNLRKLYKRKQKLAAETLVDLQQVLQPPPKTTEHTSDGFYILLHSIAQRQITAQLQVNQQAIIIGIVALLAAIFSIRPMMHVLHHESPQFIPLLLVIITAIITIVLACKAYSHRGKYLEDRLESGEYPDFEQQILNLRDRSESIDQTIIVDCFELRAVSEQKRKSIRSAGLTLAYGLTLAFLIHFIIHLATHA